ncbi:uncharacterized protein LOC108161448 [Drosophila miranda]|uniref:uncharacterized protein LOC108161448 n=1 Tax=Drosophila miranda TaxID=7229 RepID=UPI0007E63C71|nr:uncharacterized protein LOC108161448 [Drosophila miranda]
MDLRVSQAAISVTEMETTEEPGQKPKWLPFPRNVRTFILPLQVLCKNSVLVSVEDKIFKCSKVVLVANCQIFSSTLEIGHTLKLTSSCLSSKMFIFAYGWMVTNHAAIPYEDMINMLMVADFLKCSPLENSILTIFNDVDSYLVKDSVRLYFEAIEKGEKGDRLARQMLPRVGHSFLILVASKEFARLTAEQLYDLLSSSHLAVHSETEVFCAVVYWLREDYKSRQEHEQYLFKQLKNKRIWIKDPLCPHLNHKISWNTFGDYMQLLNAEPEANFLSRMEILSPKIPPAVSKESILDNILENIYENIISSS